MGVDGEKMKCSARRELSRTLAECVSNRVVTIKEEDFPLHAGFPEAIWTGIPDDVKARDIGYMAGVSLPKWCRFERSVKELGGGLPGVYDSILDAIGNTPMVRISRFGAMYGMECELLAKCEYLNAGGSVKDRIGKSMVEAAEASGRLKAGDVLIEPTSGNTGIGLAMVAAVKGYGMVVTLPEKMSKEKVNVMKGLGAEILRTPTEAAWNSPESHIGLALKLNKLLPNSHILDQYSNPANPLVHYYNTADEILKQCNYQLDMIVIGVGTGGTITGIGKRIKQCLPNCIVVGVDPEGSSLALPDSLNDKNRNVPYSVEGIGYDFVPSVADRSVVDFWFKSNDKDSFTLAKQLIQSEALLVGGSSGAALAATLLHAKSLNKHQRCCILLPDSARNYMSKFIDHSWMVEHGYTEINDAAPALVSFFEGKTVSNLKLNPPITIISDATVADAVSLMDKEGIDQIPVVNADSEIIGVVTEGNLASYLQSGRLTRDDHVENGMYRQFKKVGMNCSLSDVSKILESHAYVVIVSEQKCHENSRSFSVKQIVVGVITRIDLLRFLVE